MLGGPNGSLPEKKTLVFASGPNGPLPVVERLSLSFEHA